jgi:protein ImuB
MVGQDGRQRAVVAANAAAQRAGLRIGMPATKAQALVVGLVIQHADPAADAEALERLAVWALRYSPVVAVDPPDGIVIDATGATHLHGGEEAMLGDLIARLSATKITARAAMADTRGAAHALARYAARPRLVAPEQGSARLIEPLPIAALRLPQDMVDDLRRLGFERIADLIATPRAPLTLRFGPEVGRRLDQARGLTGDPIDPVRPADIVEVQQLFAEPIGARETITRYVAKLTVQLCEELEARGLGARRLDLLFGLVDNRLQAVRIGTAQPVRDVKRLTRLLCDKIETVDPGFGIEIMRLAATLAEPFAIKQSISSLVEETEADVSGLIDVLGNRVGEGRLYRFAPVASDVPERSMQRVAATAPDSTDVWPGHWPRPARLLASPEPIETVALLRTIRRSISHGGAYGGASGGPTVRSGCSGSGGSGTRSSSRSGITSRSRTMPANASGSSAPATARTRRRDPISGSCTGSSDEPVRRTPGHIALFVPSGGVVLRRTVCACGPDRDRSAGGRRPQQPCRDRAGP